MTLGRHRVHTTLLSARAAERIRAHPSLRLSGQSLAHFPLGTIARQLLRPPVARRNRNVENKRCAREFFCLALPALRRIDGRDSEIYRCGIISMRVLRFFLTSPSLAIQRCAPARQRMRVLTRRCTTVRTTLRHTLLHVRRWQRSATPSFLIGYSLVHSQTSQPNWRSNPIAHRVRRKRQRLPPSLLIENASGRHLTSPRSVCPRRSDHSGIDPAQLTQGG